MIASGELPDLIYGPGAYQEGLEAGIKDGYFLDMTPYLDTYLSDYNKLRTQNKETEKISVTDSGKVAAAYQIYTQQQSPWMGLMIRKDWLDELNLQVPKTVADWETVLTAFKEKKNAYAPLALCGGLSSISKGFNVGTSAIFSSPYMNDNGKVTYTETSDNMKAYLKVLKDWYKKGLIDPDFMTKQNSPFVDTSMVTSDQTGAFVTMYTLSDMYKAASKDPKFQLVAVADPVPDAGSETKIGMKIPMVGGAGLAVSADSKNKELAMQWIDYLFTEEGSMLANYGIEGDTYKLGQDGKPVFAEKVTKNPDGMSMAQAMALYTLPPSMLPCHYDWTRELAGVSKESQEMMNVWGQQKTDNVMPAITMTSDENKEYASNFNNIKTFTSEQESQFVTGVADIDKGWDEFVNQVNKLGVDKCVQLEQAALDRYLKR
jgi:putative aldouronate transport system substrate-binding protein